MRRITVLFATIVVPVAPVPGQAKLVPVTISVTSGGKTAGPVAALELSITRLDGNSTVPLITDSLGLAKTRLSPARYRIRSMKPFRRDSEIYSWDIEVAVRALDKSVIVSLNRQNADLGIDFASMPQRTTPVAAQPVPPTMPVGADSAAFVAFKAGGIYYRNVTQCEATRIPRDAERIYFRSAEDARRLGLIASKEAGCR
jgi:hypothetical protein